MRDLHQTSSEKGRDCEPATAFAKLPRPRAAASRALIAMTPARFWRARAPATTGNDGSRRRRRIAGWRSLPAGRATAIAPRQATQQQGMNDEMNSAEKLAKTVKIPPRPEALIEISAEVNRPDPDIDRIAAAIKKDVTLYGAILRLVNSPLLGGNGVKTIDRALMLLGLKRIAQIAQVVALQNQLGSKLSINRFWDTAAEVAEICAALARKFTGLPTEDAYTVGMFHDFGIPLMMQAFPDYKTLLNDANKNAASHLSDIENARYGFNHYDVGFELGRVWCVPPHLNETIRFQPELPAIFADRVVVDDIDTIKTLLALLEMAKNISATHRKLWRAQDDASGLGIDPVVLVHLELEPEDYVELREDMVFSLSGHQKL
jgi:HD-like signal output (HDOD) protein